MSGYYMLIGTKPVPVSTVTEWAIWFEKAGRVASDYVGDVHISTVFLGIDHSFGSGPPLLFETMIFGGDHDGYQERFRTWDEAAAGHKIALALVKGETCAQR